MFSYGVRLVSMAVSVITLIGAPVAPVLAAVVAEPEAAVVAEPPAVVAAPAAVVAARAVVAELLLLLLSLPHAAATRLSAARPTTMSRTETRPGERVVNLKMYPPRDG